MTPPRRDSAIRSRRAWSVLIIVVFLGLSSDLFSKWIAFREIGPQPVAVDRDAVLAAQAKGESLSRLIPPDVKPVPIVPNLLDFTLVLNPGAVFGIGAGKRWFFVAFTVAALLLAVWMFGAWTRSRDAWAHVGIGLLVSGGLGNLYDRLAYGCVRDFIHPLPGVLLPFGWTMPLSGGREVWPYVSNVADLWLLIGIAMLMWFLWRQGKSNKSQPGPNAS
ncbi:MAG: signal peptidase II [Phycisphaeraceae bacterium]|nr:signal peptidase II [Phycisphaeraceae bacterium]